MNIKLAGKLLFVLNIVVFAGCQSGWAAAAPTVTTLAVTAGSSDVTAVKAGTVVTLVATVKSGTAGLKVGQVDFCDAEASYCTDIHLLGAAQLTAAGTAAIKFRPGIGSHNYKAVFVGTNLDAGSSSAVSALSVAGATVRIASSTTISESGDWGKYVLSSSVTEIGSTVAPVGIVSFVDTSNGNAVLGRGGLNTVTPGLGWISSQSLSGGPEPNLIAIGDFNRDGIADMAVANGSSNSLTILLGNGDGTFEQVSSPSIGYGPSAIATGDFNQDGIPDLAVVEPDNDQVEILLGNGDGTFTAVATSPATGAEPAGIAVGDFNGDGIPDLAVANQNYSGTGSVTILLGKGDGTFTAAAKSPAAGSDAYAIVTGDFNGDGKLDLAVTNQQQETLTILLGHGDGTFVAAASPAVTGYCTNIASADFNGDGKPDLVVECENEGLVEVLLGNGDGTFTVAPAFPSEEIEPDAIAIGDFNGDGIPDIALLDGSIPTGGVVVFLGRGDGTFGPEPVNPSSIHYPVGVLAAGDFNGDGRTDLTTANTSYSSPAEMLVFLNEPTETATTSATVSVIGTGQHLVDASFDGSANYFPSLSGTIPLWGELPATTTTLAVTYGSNAVTSIAPGAVITLSATVEAGSSPVTSGQVKFCNAPASLCTDIHLLGTAALSSSGKAVFRYTPGPGVYSYQAVFVKDGYGLGSSSSPVALTVGPAKTPIYADTATITESGQVADYSLTAKVIGAGGSAAPTGTVSFLDTSFANKVLATAPLGPSTAGVGWLLSQTTGVGSNVISEVTGDFNGDGFQDLAVLSQAATTPAPAPIVTVLFGKGGGAFVAGPTTQVTGAQSSPVMIAGDFNGDGKTDLAVLSTVEGSASYVTTLLGTGTGSFTLSTASLVLSQGVVGGNGVPGSITSADFNGDGKLDLAVVGDGIPPGGVTILPGNGDGTFQLGSTVDPIGEFGLIATGDFNGDGIPDLVATNYSEDGGGPTIFIGKGDGTFTWSVASFALDYYPTSIVVGDFAGNGVLDLAFSDLNGVKIALGKGDGTFKETTASPIPVSSELYSLIAADFNDDGKLDLVGIDNYNDEIDLLTGAGDGTFTVSITTPNVSQTFLGPFAIAAADFNADGLPDLAMLTKNVDTATILLARPTETATATVTGIAPVGAGTHNVEASYGGDSHYRAAVSGTVSLSAGLTPVVISPAPGTYTTVQTITLSESIPGATIYYSAYGIVNTNGFVPYTGPIQLTEGGFESIQYYASEAGYQGTEYETANFTINLPAAPAPTFSLATGSYGSAQTVTISDPLKGATIYYTTDGALPTTSSAQYESAVTVTSSETLVAMAIASGYSVSTPASAQYIITTSNTPFIYNFAGSGNTGYSGDGGLATAAVLNDPEGSAIDKSGNFYIADTGNNRIRKVSPAGIITTVAGNGIPGYKGDKGSATAAELDGPVSVALDSDGNLYIADSANQAIRKVAIATGIITTVAGNGLAGYSGDGGLATSAELAYPEGVALDGAGNLYIADTLNDVVRKVTASTGLIATIAGKSYQNGGDGYGGDGGPATNAQMRRPVAIALDSKSNFYIADQGNNTIRKVTAATNIITTVAGNGTAGYSGDGGQATSANLYEPWALAIDSAGNLYIDDEINGAVRKVTASTGIISTVAGNGMQCNPISGDGGPAASAELCYAQGLSVDETGNLYVSDQSNRVRKIVDASTSPSQLTATPVFNEKTGTYASTQTITLTDATPGAAIYITMDGTAPTALSAGYTGPIYVSGGVTIKAVAVAPGYLASASAVATYTITSRPPGVITTVAGDGEPGYNGDGGAATSAALGAPTGVAVDGSGNVYIVDAVSNVVRKVSSTTGLITTVAGNGTTGYSGDGGLATAAEFNNLNGIAVDSHGDLYIADTNNNAIRKVTAASGVITTVAGLGPERCGYSGDGGAATAAMLCYPLAVAVDAAGDLFIADTSNNLIRKVSAETQLISTVAGTPESTGVSGDGGLATKAILEYPSSVAVDPAGNIYIAEQIIERIRRVTASTGIISTIAGNGDIGNTGNNGPAISAQISGLSVAVDSIGNVYIGGEFSEVRMVWAINGFLYSVAGTGIVGFSGDGGSATVAELAGRSQVALGESGVLYIADESNSRVRKVTFNPTATPVFSVAPGTYAASQSVKITDAESAVIYFTTDGSTPTTASAKYTGAITVSATETVKAIAISPGYAPSAVASAGYTIQ